MIRTLNAHAPLVFGDGRLYDVLQFEVCSCTPVEVHRFCKMEVFHRGCDFSHLFFHFYLYSSLFNRGGVDDDESSILLYTRMQVWDYLNTHRQPVPLSRWARPIVVECR